MINLNFTRRDDGYLTHLKSAKFYDVSSFAGKQQNFLVELSPTQIVAFDWKSNFLCSL